MNSLGVLPHGRELVGRALLEDEGADIAEERGGGGTRCAARPA